MKNTDLTEGPIAKKLLLFALPLLLGQVLQQLYNLADAWVVGNFAEKNAFAAVSSVGSLVFMIIGFFGGIAIGGGVIISKYYGAKDEANLEKAIHTNFLFGLIASVIATVVGLFLVPHILLWMKTPKEVLPYSLTYFRIYFGGVSTIILYNICMAIMRALGDSVHPLYYLALSSLTNVVLDLILVAIFHMGVMGAAAATVFSQGLSTALCLRRMFRMQGNTRLDLKKLKFHPSIMKEVIAQGLPTGIQNSVISIGNTVIQANINMFGPAAMAGHGAYAKIEGIAFLPITCMSMSLPTFVGQNLGAGKVNRAKRGSLFGILFGVMIAELIGFLLYHYAQEATYFLVKAEDAVEFGVIHSQVTSLFFFLLAFSHCAAGVCRGCGKSYIPMISMLSFWCGFRILYVTLAVKVVPEYRTIAMAYPITWSLSTVFLLIYLLRLDWDNALKVKR